MSGQGPITEEFERVRFEMGFPSSSPELPFIDKALGQHNDLLNKSNGVAPLTPADM